MLALLLTLALGAAQAPPVEHLAAVRVQGNTLTPDADVVRMAGLDAGAELTPALLAELPARLARAGHFRHVDVLKRFASIDDPSQVLLVLVVDEGPITVKGMKDGQPAHAVRRRLPPVMALPVLGSDEGYGFTWGAVFAVPGIAGPRTRLSVPLTWGGERLAQVELERRLDSPKLTRLRVGASLLRRENAALGAVDSRQRVWARGERELTRALRAGAWGGVDFVTFGGADSRVVRTGIDATIDTRADPMLPGTAVFTRTAVERLDSDTGGTALCTLVDVSGSVSGLGPATVVARVYRDGATRPVPPYLKVLLGRDATLRGIRADTVAADTTAAGSLELRVPVTSPLRLARVGVRAFIDAAAAYDAGAHLQDQRFTRGVGGGVWMTATVLRLAVDVAHASTGSTRVVVSSGVAF